MIHKLTFSTNHFSANLKENNSLVIQKIIILSKVLVLYDYASKNSDRMKNKKNLKRHNKNLKLKGNHKFRIIKFGYLILFYRINNKIKWGYNRVDL